MNYLDLEETSDSVICDHDQGVDIGDYHRQPSNNCSQLIKHSRLEIEDEFCSENAFLCSLMKKTRNLEYIMKLSDKLTIYERKNISYFCFRGNFFFYL